MACSRCPRLPGYSSLLIKSRQIGGGSVSGVQVLKANCAFQGACQRVISRLCCLPYLRCSQCSGHGFHLPVGRPCRYSACEAAESVAAPQLQRCYVNPATTQGHCSRRCCRRHSNPLLSVLSALCSVQPLTSSVIHQPASRLRNVNSTAACTTATSTAQRPAAPPQDRVPLSMRGCQRRLRRPLRSGGEDAELEEADAARRVAAKTSPARPTLRRRMVLLDPLVEVGVELGGAGRSGGQAHVERWHVAEVGIASLCRRASVAAEPRRRSAWAGGAAGSTTWRVASAARPSLP